MTTNWLNIRPNSLVANLAPVWSREPVFEEMFNWAMGNGATATATLQNFKLNVAGDEANYYIYAMLPGIDLDKLEVSVLDNKLTIAGEFTPAPFGKIGEAEGAGEAERASQENTRQDKQSRLRWLYRELPTTPTHFRRELTLPVALAAEKVEAHYDNGILRILVPQAEAARPHKVKVFTGRSEGENVSGSQFPSASQPSQLESSNQNQS